MHNKATALRTQPRPHQQPLFLLDRLQPEVQEILTRLQVPRSEADALIHDTMLALLYKWDGITNHEYWLLKTLESRCQRLYGKQA